MNQKTPMSKLQGGFVNQPLSFPSEKTEAKQVGELVTKPHTHQPEPVFTEFGMPHRKVVGISRRLTFLPCNEWLKHSPSLKVCYDANPTDDYEHRRFMEGLEAFLISQPNQSRLHSVQPPSETRALADGSPVGVW